MRFENSWADRQRLEILLPALFGLLFLLLFEFTDLDLTVSGYFFDPTTGAWPYRHHWFTETIAHKGGKYAVILVGLGALLYGVWRWVRPGAASGENRGGRVPGRRAAFYLFTAIALSTGIVGLLKHQSNLHCPWDMEPFGGNASYLRLLDPVPAGYPKGRCFPGGHASGGFALFALYCIGRGRRSGFACWGLTLGLIAGNLLGFTQVMRGAHLLSHQLWTAILVWYICLALAWLYKLEPRAESPRITPKP